jgi:hypothetical protein
MPLTEEDVAKIGELFEAKVKTLRDEFAASMDKLSKRVQRVETGFSLLADAARKVVTDDAFERHDRLLRATFDKSDLLALPQFVENNEGGKDRAEVTVTVDDVAGLIAGEIGNEARFEVELAKPAGFRILVSSRSPQTRRRVAAGILNKCKGLLDSRMKLHLQYDKPYELRKLQKRGHQFLGTVKRRGGSAVMSTDAKQGYLIVNGHRLTPEYLVPDNCHWDKLADMVKTRLRAWKTSTIVPERGFMFENFGAAMAIDRGVFELDDVVVDDDDTVTDDRD